MHRPPLPFGSGQPKIHGFGRRPRRVPRHLQRTPSPPHRRLADGGAMIDQTPEPGALCRWWRNRPNARDSASIARDSASEARTARRTSRLRAGSPPPYPLPRSGHQHQRQRARPPCHSAPSNASHEKESMTPLSVIGGARVSLPLQLA